MRIMFIMMNSARLSVGMQGLAVAERAYQQSLEYAQERRQGRAIGATGPDSAIIEFPDVRRMLMTQKTYLAALRRLMLLNAAYVDHSTHEPDQAARVRADEIVGLLTPICKAFGTDLGNELTSLALQIHGGMGFIEETGAAQHFRDVRIAAIYEGTNGIQAADLVGRKLGVRGGASFLEFIATMREIEPELAARGERLRLDPRGARAAVRRAGEGHQVDARHRNSGPQLGARWVGAVPAHVGPVPRRMADGALGAGRPGNRRLGVGQHPTGARTVLRGAVAAAGLRPAQCGDRGFPRPVRAGCRPSWRASRGVW